MVPENTGWLAERRSLLKAIAGVGVPILGGVGLSVGRGRRDTAPGAPRTEWAREYGGKDREYAFTRTQEPAAIVQTTDGGYALCAEGHEISETGESDQYMALIVLTDSGRYQWHSFVKDDQQDSEQTSSDVLQTDEDGFVIAGSRKSPVAQVAKLDREGNRQWFTELPASETENPEDRQASVKTVVHAVDSGYVLAGTFSHEKVRVVNLDEAGNVVWDNRYEGESSYTGLDAFTRAEDGYVFVSRTTLFKLDAKGNKQWTADTSPAMTVFDIIQTADGGFAMAGDDRTVPEGESQNFVLVKLDADGAREWRREYDGPFEGTDIALSVTQTADSGYAIAGRMQKAYSGDNVAAVVRTDGDGTEQWEKLVEEDSDRYEGDIWAPAATSIIQTADDGFAMTNLGADTPGAAKLAPAGDTQPTETPTRTATDSPTDTPTSTPGDTETPTEGNGSTDPSDDTSTPTATETTGDGSSDGGGDCEI